MFFFFFLEHALIFRGGADLDRSFERGQPNGYFSFLAIEKPYNYMFDFV